MADKSLLILITRMEGSVDEWEAVWGFDPDAFMAFVCDDAVELVAPAGLQRLDLNERLGCGLWVVHGMSVEGRGQQLLYESLERVAWERESAAREVTLQIHPGLGRTITEIEPLLFDGADAYPNTLWLLRRATNYNLGGDSSHPVAKLAEAVRSGRWDKYRERLQGQETLPLPVKVSGIKHAVANVLKPIDIDLDGLREANLQHWGEIAEKYKGGAAREKLEKARALVYGREGEAETLEQVLDAAASKYGPGAAAREWEAVRRVLPRSDAVVHKGTDISLMLERLENPASREAFEEYLRDGKCPFRDWLVELDDALADLRRALAARDA